jgi:hypothetical protein
MTNPDVANPFPMKAAFGARHPWMGMAARRKVQRALELLRFFTGVWPSLLCGSPQNPSSLNAPQGHDLNICIV